MDFLLPGQDKKREETMQEVLSLFQMAQNESLMHWDESSQAEDHKCHYLFQEIQALQAEQASDPAALGAEPEGDKEAEAPTLEPKRRQPKRRKAVVG